MVVEPFIRSIRSIRSHRSFDRPGAWIAAPGMLELPMKRIERMERELHQLP